MLPHPISCARRYLRRLARRHQILAAYERGDYASLRQAALAAGIVRKPTSPINVPNKRLPARLVQALARSRATGRENGASCASAIGRYLLAALGERHVTCCPRQFVRQA